MKKNKLIHIIKNLDYYLQPVLMITLLAIALLQVLYRFIPFIQTPWTLELITFLFSGSVWMGISIAVKENANVGILAVYNLFPRKLQICCKVFNNIIFGIMMISFGYFGSMSLLSYIRLDKLTPAMHAPYALMRLPILLGSIYTIYRILQVLNSIRNHKDPEFYDEAGNPKEKSKCTKIEGAI